MTHVAVAILRNNGTILVCQRKKGSRYELKWEFPGGKVEQGETVVQCLRRELMEELSLSIRAIERIEFQVAEYDDGGRFQVAYCHVSEFSGEPANNVFETIRWVTPKELTSLDILKGNASIIEQLAHE